MTAGIDFDRPQGALVGKVIAYLDDPSCNVWSGLHLMEKNGIEYGLRYGELHAYLTDPTSPLDGSSVLSADQEKDLVLALRDVVREDLSLPPLSEEERREWVYEQRYPDRVEPASKLWGEAYAADPRKVEELKTELSATAPDLMQALTIFLTANAHADPKSPPPYSISWLLVPLRFELMQIESRWDSIDALRVGNQILDSIKKSLSA